MKENKGITLVALVVTIIILLILSGISIMVLTQTGIFEKAKEAKEKSQNAQLEENQTLDNYVSQIDDFNTVASNKESFATHKDLLWSGKYNTSVNTVDKQSSGGCKLNNNYNIEDYEFVLIITAINLTGSTIPEYHSTLFPIDLIKENYGYPAIEMSAIANSSYSSRMNVGFINKNTFYIAYENLYGWPGHYISHIYGIK